MTFGEDEIDFPEADRRYAELKRQHEAGNIDDEEFDTQLKQMMVQDDEGRWWAKSRRTGKWHYHDGKAWARGNPPGYGPPGTLPEEEGAPDRRSQPEQSERLPFSQPSLSGSAPPQVQNEVKQRRGIRRWLVVGAPFFVAAVTGIILWMLVPGVARYVQGASEESSGATPGYALLKHDSGAFSVEIPSDWDERVVTGSEGGERGRDWSLLLGDGAIAGPSMTAVNDLYSWRNGTWGHQGVYVVASKELAQGHSDDELVASGPNDYSSSCEPGTIEDFERPPYSGKMLQWNNCGGDSDHVAITLSGAPEGRECVFVAQIGGLPRVEEETIRHILTTFETDCAEIV